MTEAEWLTCDDPTEMLDLLRGKVSGRKLSLFAVACCRNDCILMEDRRSRQAVEWTERLIEGLPTDDDPDAPSDGDCYLMASAANHCMAVAAQAADGDAEAAEQRVRWVIESLSDREDSALVLRGDAALLRCVLGNPYHPVTLDSSWMAWNDGAVGKIAQTIYSNRDFDRMPELAEALERAGCTRADILDHCRGPGPHVWGCWAVDLIIGES